MRFIFCCFHLGCLGFGLGIFFCIYPKNKLSLHRLLIQNAIMSNVKTSKLNRQKWQQMREINLSMIEKIKEEVGIDNLVEKETLPEIGEEFLVFDQTIKLEQCEYSGAGVKVIQKWNVYMKKPCGYRLSSEWMYVGTLNEDVLPGMLWHSYYGAGAAKNAIEYVNR